MRNQFLFAAGLGLIAAGCFLVSVALTDEFIKRGISQ
jgi:hypothetical protein